MDIVVITGNCFHNKTVEAFRMINLSCCAWISENLALNTFSNYVQFYFNKYNEFVFDGTVTHDLRYRILTKQIVHQLYQNVLLTRNMNYFNINKRIIITCMPQDKEFWLYDMPSDLKLTFIDLMDDSF